MPATLAAFCLRCQRYCHAYVVTFHDSEAAPDGRLLMFAYLYDAMMRAMKVDVLMLRAASARGAATALCKMPRYTYAAYARQMRMRYANMRALC